MRYKSNRLDDYHYMLLNAFVRNNTDMWNEFVFEFVDELTPKLPIVNSTIIRVVRAILHECFSKRYDDCPDVGYDALERISSIVEKQLLDYKLNLALHYPRNDLSNCS